MDFATIDPFLEYLESIRSRTTRVAQAIPSDRIEWRHQDGVFTLGDLVRHIAAIERWMFAENVAGRPSSYPGCDVSLATGRDAVLDYLARMHRESVAIFRELTPARLQEKCTTPGGADMRVWKWLRAMVEHEVHHRGQLHLMLTMIGVETPPLYGLTSEEVRARSVTVDVKGEC